MKKKWNSTLVFLVFMLVMIGLGISDSNRGVFSAIFERELALTKPQVSMVVTVSYVGNLLFMLLGGNAADRFDRKKACMGILGLWTAAQVIFVCTDSYAGLLIGMFISMGASTLMNTMINILSPFFFGTMAGLYINILFFIQGIGTSGNQKLTGTYASGYSDYRRLCMGLSVIGIVSLILLGLTRFRGVQESADGEQGEFPDATIESNTQRNSLPGGPNASAGKSFCSCMSSLVLAMGLVFGFYFVAEHGILNWWFMYCTQGLGMSAGSASTGVSLFFGTMTVGRLLMAPLVQKLGTRKSITILGGLGTAVYLLGIFLGKEGIWILSISGIFMSIIYPTIVLLLQELFPKNMIATVTGMVISIGTLFDIAFNAVFGNLVETVGFGICRIIFPVAILCFYGGFLLVIHRKRTVLCEE